MQTRSFIGMDVLCPDLNNVLSWRQQRELIALPSICGRDVSCFVSLSHSDDGQVPNRLSLERLATYHLASYDREIADLLQSTESIEQCLRIGNWDALIPVVVQNDGFATLLPQIEKPSIANGQLRKTHPLRCQNRHSAIRLAGENFLRHEPQFQLIVFDRRDCRNGTHKHKVKRVRSEAAIHLFGHDARLNALDRLVAYLLRTEYLGRCCSAARKGYGNHEDDSPNFTWHLEQF